ncbi:MAG: suppressor of fused domain protein [Mycoplasmatales bacterium]
MSVNLKNKIIAKTLDKLIAGKSKVERFYNEDKSCQIDVITITDNATNSITMSTVNLSDIDLDFKKANEYKVGVEFIMVSDIKYDNSLDVLIDSSFIAIKNKNSCQPGNIYSNVIQKYYLDSDMKHILLTYPFLWNDFNKITYENKSINWLQLVPISDNELKFLQEHNLDKLEELFEKEKVDVFNFNRKSIL